MIEQEGDLDLRAFLGLSEAVRPGYERIRFRYSVQADASRERLEELCDYVQKTSPVLDIIRNPVPVSIEMAKAPRRESIAAVCRPTSVGRVALRRDPSTT